MSDLTTGPITRHLLKTTGFMLVTMIFQTLYFLIDLYWVGRLGTEAVAAVGIAGNISFLVLALTQMLGVGTTTVVSHAVGRKDFREATLAFNQSLGLGAVVGGALLVIGLALRMPYVNTMGADAVTAKLAGDYLLWFMPAMALQFPMISMGAAMRGTGNFRPTMVVSTGTVVMNMVLAPFLIFGWGTGLALGVAGAAISTLVAVIIGVAWLSTYFVKTESLLHFKRPDMRPLVGLWKRMLAVGLPTGFEFALMAVYLFLVYTLSRPFGAAAQAGFGIGMRIVQAGFMPVVALGFGVAPVAGQNFGARNAARVKHTFRDAAFMATAAMVVFGILCHIAPASLVHVFSKDPSVIAVGTEYLRIVSWGYVASGLIFVSSSMFQAMGNTLPSLVASGARILLVAIPVIALSRLASFQLTWIWYVSLGAVVVQLALSLLLLRREFRRRLAFA